MAAESSNAPAAPASATGGSGGNLRVALEQEREKRRRETARADARSEELDALKARLDALERRAAASSQEPSQIHNNGGTADATAAHLRELLQALVPPEDEDLDAEEAANSPRAKAVEELVGYLAGVAAQTQEVGMTVREQKLQAIKSKYAPFVSENAAERRIAEALFAQALNQDPTDPDGAARLAAQETAKFRANGSMASVDDDSGVAPPSPPNAGGAGFVMDRGEAIAPEAKNVRDLAAGLRASIQRALAAE
jgi:hypothetical protein